MKNSLALLLMLFLSTAIFSQKKEISSIAKKIKEENFSEAQALLDQYKTAYGQDAAYLFFTVKNKTSQPIQKADLKSCINQLKDCEKSYGSINEKDRAYFCKKLEFCESDIAKRLNDATKSYWNFIQNDRNLEEINQFLNDFQNIDFQSEVILLRDELVYSKIQNSSDEEDFRNFIAYYPASVFSKKAQQKIEELAFGRAQTNNTREEYTYFIQLYPNSLLVTKAEEKILGIEWSGIKESNDIAKIKKFNSEHANSAYGEECRKLIASYEWQILCTSEDIPAIEEWAKANSNFPEATLASERVLQLKDVVLPYLTKNRTYKFFYVLSKKIDESNEYDKVSRLDNNDFFVMKNNLLGVVNKKGKAIITPKYVSLQKSGSNYLGYSNKKHQLVSSTGKIIQDLNYNFIQNTYQANNEFWLVWNLVNGIKKCGVINSEGKEIIPVKYDYIEFIESGFLLYTKGKPKNLCDLVKTDGTVILSKIETAVCNVDGYYIFKKNGNFGVVKSNGKIIVDPIYFRITMDVPNEFVLQLSNNNRWIADSLGNELIQKGVQRIDHLTESIYQIGNLNKFDLYNSENGKYFGSLGYEEASAYACPNYIVLGRDKEIEIIESATLKTTDKITVEDRTFGNEYEGDERYVGDREIIISDLSASEFDESLKPEFSFPTTTYMPMYLETSRAYNSTKYATFERLGNYVLINKTTGQFGQLYPHYYSVLPLCNGFFAIKQNETDLFKIVDTTNQVIKESVSWAQGISDDKLFYTIKEGNSTKSYLLNTSSNTTKELGVDVSTYTEFDDYSRYTYKDIQVYELADGTQLYDKSIDFKEYEARILTNQAFEFQRNKNYPEAIRLYQESLKLTPRNVSTYMSISNCYRDSYQYDKALEWVNKAIYESPVFTEIYYTSRIAIYEKQGNKYSMAVDYNTLGTRSTSSNLYYYVQSAYYYTETNYLYETIRVTDEAISRNKGFQKNSNLANIYNNRGTAKFRLGQYSAAISDFNSAIKCELDYNKNNKAMFLDNIGASYLNQGNNAMACKYFKQACALGRCTNTWRCR